MAIEKSKSRKFDIEKYDLYVKDYIEKSEKLGKPISHPMLRKQPYNLPDARWFVVNCPDKNVTSWAEFIDWCGFVAKGKLPSKGKMINLIYKMQSKLGKTFNV